MTEISGEDVVDEVQISILNIGHGNACVIRDGELTIVDGGKGAGLLEHLLEWETDAVANIFVSHSDADHANGIRLALKALPELMVGEVFVNPSQQKRTKSWKFFVEHLEWRRRTHGTKLSLLTADNVEQVELSQRTRLGVIAPLYTEIMGPHDVNRTSGVLVVTVNDERIAILPGDMDGAGLQRLLDRKVDLSAKVLVFPHHGGLPGEYEPAAFAQLLVSQVRPEFTVISLSRNVFENPHPGIAAGLCASLSAGTRFACTQLSKHCARELPNVPLPFPTRGPPSAQKDACIGTVTLRVDESGLRIEPDPSAHRDHVDQHVPHRMCASLSASQ